MINLPKHYGTCFGSNRAIEIAYANKNQNACIYKEILHNEELIKDLEKNGIKCENEIKKDKKIIIRAHGESLETFEYLEKNNIEYIDSTCPNVKKVQRLINEYFIWGYNIIIIGKKNHPEVIAENGWCNNSAIILENLDDIKNIKNDNLFIVIQTTYNEKKALEIVNEIKKKYKKIKFINTICKAQSLNQISAKELTKDMDYMIVIGGSKSSNTKELFNVCNLECTSFLVSSKEDLLDVINKIDLEKKIGITAGASTPQFQVKEYIDIIKKRCN